MGMATNGRMVVPLQNIRGTSSITTVEILCTPAMAEEFLKRNINNRSVNQQRVLHLVRQILAGRWALTHQGIAFWDDDTLADGQHRLTAIAKAGVAVPVLMTTGLPKPAIHAIDAGLARSTKDVLQFVGISMNAKWVATVKILFMQREMVRSKATTWSANKKIPTEALQDFVPLVLPAIEFSAIATAARGLSHSCFHAALASAWFTQEHDRLARFKHLVADGVDAERHESAAIRLRDFLMTTHLTRGGSDSRQEIFQRCCTAIRAFVEGRGISKLYCRSDAAFDIPGSE